MRLEENDLTALGRFAERTRLSDVPDGVVAGARLLLLDTLGALLGGLRYPEVRALGSRLRERGATGHAGPSFGLLVTLGTAATWLDADSGGSFHPQGHRLPPVPTAHPAAHSLPVLLRAAARGDLGDRRVVEMFLVANEIGMRAGVASSLRPGMHPHGVHGPGAAAVAGGLLRELGADELTAAFVLGSSLPLAATLAVPMRGGTVRNLWTGLGAYYGASAAEWVIAGARPGTGVFTALYDGAVCSDLSSEELLGGLGTRWQLAASYFKPYACARWIHPALDAWHAATDGAGLAASDVAEIEVDTFAFAASLDAVEIHSDLHARFSLPYCLATVAVDGELHAPGFLPENLARIEVAALARRVRVREEAQFTGALPRERPTRVSVRTRDGRLFRGEVRQARGNPDTPLTGAEVAEKFRRNVGDSIPVVVCDAVIAALMDTDKDGGRGHTIAEVSRLVIAGLGSGHRI